MRQLLWFGVLSLLAGCAGKPSRILPPAIDAEQAGLDAVSEYDKNANDQIDGAELDAVPGVKAALKALDKNTDGQVSAQEITDRINLWKERKTGIMSLSCHVTLDGRPLENAEVTIVPEKFLGPEVKPAKGTTGSDGRAMLAIDDAELKAQRINGAQCGFYKVEIVAPAGRSLPARYNTSTTLGAEVSPDADWANTGGIEFDLKSK